MLNNFLQNVTDRLILCIQIREFEFISWRFVDELSHKQNKFLFHLNFILQFMNLSNFERTFGEQENLS